jgi:hypothetical protein
MRIVRGVWLWATFENPPVFVCSSNLIDRSGLGGDPPFGGTVFRVSCLFVCFFIIHNHNHHK